MCGIIGIVGNQNVVKELRFGLYDLQHRGQDAAGIALFNGKDYWAYRGEGLVAQVFSEEVIERAYGRSGIGQVRYSTIGDIKKTEKSVNAQPLQAEFQGEQIYLGHNGNLIAFESLKKEAKEKGYQFQTTSDTEVILALLATSERKDIIEALVDILPRLKGAFSLVILYKNKVIGVRDKFGIRPLCLGRNESSFILASESCAFYTIGGNLIRDIQPGELIVLDEDGVNKELGKNPFIWAENPQLKVCIFEFVYFARPDSIIDGQSPNNYRLKAGEFLAKDHPAQADIVMPIPDSGKIYDIGFSEASGLSLRYGLFRNVYVAKRTFLADRSVDRFSLQRTKLHPLKDVVYGKKLAVLDDSIIRANVTSAVVSMLYEAGAREIHLRVGSSPVCFTCHLGIDIATKGELIASSLPTEEIRRHIRADSLEYLSQERMIEASGFSKENLSMGCFSGEYAVPFEEG